MSQNPDETHGPQSSGSQAQDNEFESELDYGAFAADEPDFPEDRLEHRACARGIRAAGAVGG